VTTIKNHLQAIREQRGIAAAQLAREVGISRATVYAIEAGNYTPNTAVALQMARVLEVSVEDLFSIGPDTFDRPLGNIKAELLATEGDEYSTGELVRIGRVGSRMIAVPAPHFPTFLSDADGAIAKQSKTHATIRPMVEFAPGQKQLVIAGCDPALSVLASELKSAGTEVISVPCSSQEALDWLKKGFVHVAGTHLRDRATGEYNLPLVTALFGKGNIQVVTFAEWEQGLVVQRGNPKRIRSVADLAGKRIKIVNREKGSGARDLLDRNLCEAGILPRMLKGYDQIAASHMVAALSVSNAQADCCVATTSAARCLGLDFIPLSSERFDLVVASTDSDTPGICAMLEALNRASLRRKLKSLAGYEVRHTGEMLA
jgi:putative molybdopterin biosynthesis protein